MKTLAWSPRARSMSQVDRVADPTVPTLCSAFESIPGAVDRADQLGLLG